MLHALVVSVLMFFGQVHFCQPEYTLPSGETCFTCPTLSDLDHQDTAGSVAASHGDCHDCCTIQACDDNDGGKVQAASPNLALELALAPDLPELQIQPEPVVFEKVTFIEGCPPTGPPSLASSRGPPTLQPR